MQRIEPPRMRPLEALLPFSQALQRVLDACTPLSRTERLSLPDAAERVLARDVVAARDVPPFDRAAMDGYAVRAEDTRGASDADPRPLRVGGVVHAGAARPRRLGPKTCIQIATGAPMPAGADAVVMVERTRARARGVLVLRPVGPRENVTFRGSDLRKGDRVLRAGQALTPARLAVAAALGQAALPVYARPRVVVLGTGSEIRPPGTRLRPGEIYNSNTYALTALLRRHGAEVLDGGIVPDDVGKLRAALRRHRRADLIVVSGGSSAGERDLLRDAVDEVKFHGVAVKPGKPLLLGRVGRVPVVGLPGYPASCLCDAYLFVVPAVRKLGRLGAPREQRVPATLAVRVRNASGRHFFYPVRLEGGRAVPTYTESGATTSLSEADGYIEIPADATALEAGTRVDVVLF